MSGNDKKEFGDYQTPLDFCLKVCNYIKLNYQTKPKAILEPTCGIGNFLKAAYSVFDCDNLYGIEINPKYAGEAQIAVSTASLTVNNIFDINTRQICKQDDLLIIGNPPWATNANLSYNLPQKNNFKGLRGIDALTGSSNFDICEYIILQLLDEYKYTNSVICMLCKTCVARNVILEISRNEIPCKRIEMLNFNSNKVFGISVSACVLVVELSANIVSIDKIVCNVKDFDTLTKTDTLVISEGMIKPMDIDIDLEGRCQLVWRQGVKHDCSNVMELDRKGNNLINKKKEYIQIETDLVFPLVKSSHFKKPIITEFSKYVIVTQTQPKQDTSYIRDKLPLTWRYLNDHNDDFNNRKSIIYKKSAPFSMFGIGDYSFAPYKVGLSGFYKKPLFCLLYSDKSVMTDDTAYFLAFDDYDIAYCMMLLLNSKTVQGFLLSIAFLDNKRPYTVKLLSRLDFKKCIELISFDELLETEKNLLIDQYITLDIYQKLSAYINSISVKQQENCSSKIAQNHSKIAPKNF